MSDLPFIDFTKILCPNCKKDRLENSEVEGLHCFDCDSFYSRTTGKSLCWNCLEAEAGFEVTLQGAGERTAKKLVCGACRGGLDG